MSANKILTGIAGEYFVAGELSKRGYLAALTQRNTAGVDILAGNAEGTRNISIQVKTTTGKHASWRMSSKAEKQSDPNVFYVLVRLNEEDKKPDYYIVPSENVAAYIYRTHREWLSGTKRDGTPRKDSSMRVFDADEYSYLNRWDLLKLDDDNLDSSS